MRETIVRMTRRKAMVAYLLETIRYVNPKQPTVKRGKVAISRALYTVHDIADRMGWSASVTRAALGDLYGQGQVVPEMHNGTLYWRATVAKEREAL